MCIRDSAFYDKLLFNDLADLVGLILGEIAHASVGIDAASMNDFLSSAPADAVNISQADYHPLITGQIYTCNTCHLSRHPLVC